MLDCGAFGNAPPVVGITATAPIHGDRALKPRTVLFSTAGLPKEFAPGPPDPCAPATRWSAGASPGSAACRGCNAYARD